MHILKEEREILHFLKGLKEPPLTLFLKSIREEHGKWCPFANHGKGVDESCFEIFGHSSGWIEYLNSFAYVIGYVLSDEDDIRVLRAGIDQVTNAKSNPTSEVFVQNIDALMQRAAEIEKQIKPSLDKLTCLEAQRLGEALIAHKSGLFTSSTVMAATAVEARLHYLVKKKKARLYNRVFKNMTLGGIIKLFDPAAYKGSEYKSLKTIVPPEHKSLLDLVNTYRIFSAHPKRPTLDHRISESILNLTFLFLLDDSLRISDKKLLSH